MKCMYRRTAIHKNCVLNLAKKKKEPLECVRASVCMRARAHVHWNKYFHTRNNSAFRECVDERLVRVFLTS